MKRIKSRADMMNFVREAEDMIEWYGWHDRTVSPYGYAVKVTKVISDCKDYDRCTKGSKEVLVSLANGLMPILEAWEEHEQAPKVRVRSLKTGQTVTVREDMAQYFVDCGLAEII